MDDDIVQINILRPTAFDTFVGRANEKKLLKMMIESAKTREDALEHILLYGPPGLGKTTLAMIIAKEMNTNIHITSAPSITSKSDLASILMNLSSGDVLFIDEIHRLSPTIEEFLYPALEDYVIDITMGKGLSANVVRIPLKKFTLIGATTKISNVSDPLRDRFGHLVHLDFYDTEEIKEIIKRSAKIMELDVTDEIILAIARRSRGTARVANKILKIMRDYLTVTPDHLITENTMNKIFDDIGIDDEGLEKMDRKILETIFYRFENKPVGLSTLVASMSEDRKTIEEYYEPHLIKKGFLQKTTKGRIVTPKGILHLENNISKKSI